MVPAGSTLRAGDCSSSSSRQSDPLLLENVIDYTPDAICLPVAAIGYSPPTTCNVSASACAATSGEDAHGWPAPAWMNRQIGIATRSPTTSQSASMTAIQANMLISSSQGSARTNRGGKGLLDPAPRWRLLGNHRSEDRDRLLDVGVDLPLSRTVNNPVAPIDIVRICTSIHFAGNLAS
jgi:hypothetical protein